jgi:hypothetical protein
MPLSFLANKESPHLRAINIANFPDLKLFNPDIHYFALSSTQLLLVT